MIFFDQINIPEDPWEKIGVAEGKQSIKSRRVDPNFHHNVFWTRNHKGEIGFRLSYKTKLDFSKNLPQISGIDITTNKSEQGHFWLDLFLVKKKNDDLFRTISIDLLQLLFTIEKERDDNYSPRKGFLKHFCTLFFLRGHPVTRGIRMKKRCRVSRNRKSEASKKITKKFIFCIYIYAKRTFW